VSAPPRPPSRTKARTVSHPPIPPPLRRRETLPLAELKYALAEPLRGEFKDAVEMGMDDRLVAPFAFTKAKAPANAPPGTTVTVIMPTRKHLSTGQIIGTTAAIVATATVVRTALLLPLLCCSIA